jgi:hypothetical protein
MKKLKQVREEQPDTQVPSFTSHPATRDMFFFENSIIICPLCYLPVASCPDFRINDKIFDALERQKN